MATRSGLWTYRDRFADKFGRTYFRRFGPGVVSSIGLGTYLGPPTDAVDEAYVEAIDTALAGGCNVLDTAINYRCQRSERAIGRAVTEAAVDREAVVIATKGGFLPFDGDRPDDPGRYIRDRFVEPGIVAVDDLAAGSHCIAPAFLEHQLDASLDNLGLDHIDLYYLHNPETQLRARSPSAVYDAIEAAFEVLERRVRAGDIGGYGVATWDAFRVESDHPAHLSLPTVVRRARAAAATVGNETTGFSAIQLPFNVSMADAFTVQAHPGPDGPRSALAFARDAGLSVVTSASLAQGELATGMPPAVADRVAGETPVQRAINFARSAPGVTTALVGTSDPAHVTENLRAGTFDPIGADTFDRIFE